ncbi:MAG: branched-chain amino acid transaminase [Thermoplasmata archaeon]
MVALRALKKIWLNGELVPWGEARVHVLSHALHYGYAVFEGIRCHSTPDGAAIFRLDEHLERFANSAKIYRMTIPFSAPALKAACIELVRANGIPEAYLRPIAFSGYGEMGLDPSKSPIETAIGMWEWGGPLATGGPMPGVRATVSSWVRIDSRSLPPQAKCAANYANGALAKMEAATGGYDEAILLNAQGMVAEGTAENIFRVKKGIVSTPPASSGILRGVTRDTVVRLLHQQGIPFQRTDFTREELFSADELFFTGTAVGIAPLREVDGRAIGDGTNPITERIRALYDTAVHGRAEGYRSWLTYVDRPLAGTPAAPSPRGGAEAEPRAAGSRSAPAPIYAAGARGRTKAGPR